MKVRIAWKSGARPTTAAGGPPLALPGRRRLLLVIVVVIHLLLVAFGATQVRLPLETAAARIFHEGFKVYGPLTGASFGFSYFAPEIGGELRGRFEIVDESGRRIADSFDAYANREARLRINNILGLLGDAVGDTKARQALAASWAGKMFARHPDAREVVVVMETYTIPSMADFTRGEKPRWNPFYRAAFRRKIRKGDTADG